MAGARAALVLAGVFALALALASVARAAFPYIPDGANPHDFRTYHQRPGAGQTPNDFTGGLTWKFAATPESGNLLINGQASELNGVRGAHVVDDADVDTAWRTTTGRPDVLIAVLDSGIKWNDEGAMKDLRRKVHLNRGELPVPRHTGKALEDGVTCSTYVNAFDANNDGVFNVIDYACDPRVQRDPAARGGLGVGPKDLLDPQDVLIAFSNGRDEDRNGFVDDIAGWDFLDNDNDPYDDVQYGHGTGEARDSNAEADNGNDLGACPNCMVMPLRVGDSFVADVNRFAQATFFATDSGALVIQEALGALNHSALGQQAVDYAYNHGVAVIASAADEAAQHHHWPSSYAHTIVVNSIRKYDETFTPVPKSYLQFNGCTNFSSKISISVSSTSCSSEATGRGAGMAGLVYSAALNARAAGRLASHPTCRLVTGARCAISANEVRQLMASGRIGGIGQSDDVSFATEPETSCTQSRQPSCTDPNRNAPNTRAVVSPLVTSKSYPARRGHDQFYGYGRVNAARAVEGPAAGILPPEVEITSPEWYAQIDPGRSRAPVGAQIAARGGAYKCQVLVAPGSYPNNAETTAKPAGDYKVVPSAWCDGSTVHTSRFGGTVAELDLADLEARFPANAADFRGREQGTGEQTANGRPDIEPYGFVVKVVATSTSRAKDTSGEDQRNLYLHRDRDLLAGFPRKYPSDGASSPLLVDLDGDNRNELLFGTSDGIVHALKSNGREVRGWPVRGDRLPLHLGERAFRTGQANRNAGGAFLASLAAGDLNHDGEPEVVGADLEGKLYVWNARGRRILQREAVRAWSGKPLRPFVDARKGHRNRTQHGFLASPVLADLDRNDHGRLEIIAAGMDRHIYAWNDDGSRVPGFPTIVVDRSKVASIGKATQQVVFNKDAGPDLNQGAIVDTPAVGDISGDRRPEIVVGTNEEYAPDKGNEGPFSASLQGSPSLQAVANSGAISVGNGRLYAIKPTGDPDGDLLKGPSPYVSGWPVKMALLTTELLPVVGEGVNGAPALAPLTCPSGGRGVKVGALPDAGIGYVLNADGSSCYGRENGKNIGVQTDAGTGNGQTDRPSYPSLGNPAFGAFAGGTTFLAPATGLTRALDVAANEYQGGQDFVGAWDAASGQFRPGFPARMNDLQFLTGPSVADIDGKPGEEALGASAYLDLQAFDGSGALVPGYPKLTSDWAVANPLIGSFGTFDIGGRSRKAVVQITRSGLLMAYTSRAPACSPGSWPRYHHDNANSGDLRRDAVSPGKPFRVSLRGGVLRFTAPGDDGLCGTASGYQVVTSNTRLTGAGVSLRRPLPGTPRATAPGTVQTYRLPPTARGRYVAIRAVDDQGNVGRSAVVRRR